MDTFLTLVIALGGIATGIGAIWTAMLARRQLDEQRRFLEEQNELARRQARVSERQAQVSEQSLAQTERSLAEQVQSLHEQNEHVRLNLEVDLLLRLEDRFDSEQMQAIRRRAAQYIKENCFIDGSVREVHTVDRDVEEVFGFYEDLGYLVTIGAVSPYTAWRSFGIGCFAYWALGKAAVVELREVMREPKLYEDWERLMEELYELSRRSGEEFQGDFTEVQLIEYIEKQCYAGEESPTKE